MKKLYVVTFTTEVIVAAESAEEAKRFYQGDIVDEPTVSARTMAYMPDGWEPESIAYGNNKSDESDRTVGEWIAHGAAPEYTAIAAKLAKPAGGT